MKKILFAIMLSLAALSVSAQKEINQYNPKSFYEKGLLLFENKHYASAIECFEKYISSVDDKKQENVVMAKYYEAASTLFLDETDGENKITSFIKENPTALVADQAKLLYANYLFKNRKYRDALKTYSNINSSNLSKEEQDEADFKQAYCHYQTQNIAKATPLFEKLTKSENAYTNDARYYYAHILYINGQENESLEHFNILKEDNNYSDIANIYIIQINFNKNNYANVIESGEDILQKAHKNRKSDIALMIAESWLQEGNYSKSLEYYNIACLLYTSRCV